MLSLIDLIRNYQSGSENLDVIGILDIGALLLEGNQNDYSRLLSKGCTRAVGFEPELEECAKLNGIYQKAGMQFLPYFIGNGRKQKFHHTSDPMTGSLYEPNVELINMFQNLAEPTTPIYDELVETRRLDDLCELDFAVDFIKMDIQGAELQALEGAQNRVLKDVLVIQSEVEWVPLYKNQPLFSELELFLRAHGFSLHKIMGFGSRCFKPLLMNKNINSGLQQLWSDVVFVRDFTRLNTLRPQQLLKMAVILHEIYQSYDLVFTILQEYDRQRQTSLAQEYLTKVMSDISVSDEPEQTAKRHPASNPADFVSLYSQGVDAFSKDNFSSALEYFEQARAIQPVFAPLWYNLGLARAKLGRFREALDNIDHSLMLDPNAESARNLRSSLINILKSKGLKEPEIRAAVVTTPLQCPPLRVLGLQYGTDKVPHGFCDYYDKSFSDMRMRATKVLEIGVFFGSSLCMWRDWFPNAIIHGADHFTGRQGNGTFFENADRFMREVKEGRQQRIALHQLDQSRRNELEEFAAGHLHGTFDLVLDDASHLMLDQQQTLGALFCLVKPGGYFVIEDLHSSISAGYDVDPDGSNSTMLMVKQALAGHGWQSRYMTAEEQEFLNLAVDLSQTKIYGAGGSQTCIIRRKLSIAAPLSASIVPGSVVIINYASTDELNMLRQQRHIAWARQWAQKSSASPESGVTKVDVVCFGPDSLDEEFVSRNKAILSEKRGGGYWLWKPCIIEAMLAATNAEYLVYCDSGSTILEPLNAVFTALNSTGASILAFDSTSRNWFEYQWTKGEVLRAMAATDPAFSQSGQIVGTASAYRVDNIARKLVHEWLTLMQNPAFTTSAPSADGDGELPGFIEHRHDQSIFSLLVKKQKFNENPAKPAIILKDIASWVGHHHLTKAVQAGKLAEASIMNNATLQSNPHDFVTLYSLAVEAFLKENFNLARELFDRALSIKSDFAPLWYNLGLTAMKQGHHREALENLAQALVLDPAYEEAGNLHNTLISALKARADVLPADTTPDVYSDKLSRALELQAQNRLEEAEAAFFSILAANPLDAPALFSLGGIEHNRKNPEKALRYFERALEVKPDFAPLWYNIGVTQQALKQYDQALKSYNRALSLDPAYKEVLLNRGTALVEMGRHKDALLNYEQLLKIDPANDKALCNRGIILTDFKLNDLAIDTFNRLLEVSPDYAYAAGLLCFAKMHACSWDNLEPLCSMIIEGVRAEKRVCKSLAFTAISGEPYEHLLCAKIFARHFCPAQEPMWRGEIYKHRKIRIAYMSPDFREHPVGHLTAGLFEHHDKNKFEIIAVSLGIDDQSQLRRRMLAAFDEFIEARQMRSQDIASLLRAKEIDILVDLAGYTADSRPDVPAFRPVPVQVNYLGYSSTMGAEYVDYIIADQHIIPEEYRDCYSEKVAYLPDTYLPTDSALKIADLTLPRKEYGLPESGFVFCSFNHDYKIKPPVFDVWMRLLKKVPGSVLWLMKLNESAERNLRREAESRGVEPERIIFATRTPKIEDHLARYRAADLFLDTTPCNAHSTTSDVLRAGLPMVTCRGKAFAGRVAAGLLTVVDMPELITDSLEEYEKLALKLAEDKEMLRRIKMKLAENLNTTRLFDTARYCRHLEQAYIKMWERQQRGEGPDHIIVSGQ